MSARRGHSRTLAHPRLLIEHLKELAAAAEQPKRLQITRSRRADSNRGPLHYERNPGVWRLVPQGGGKRVVCRRFTPPPRPKPHSHAEAVLRRLGTDRARRRRRRLTQLVSFPEAYFVPSAFDHRLESDRLRLKPLLVAKCAAVDRRLVAQIPVEAPVDLDAPAARRGNVSRSLRG